MTHLAAAAADAPAPARPPTAAALAARIQIPRRLPIRHDGQPLRHLSHSSYTRFLLCPEDWRRHYLKGERFPATGPMFLGGSVDDALTAYYQRILDHGDALTLDQVQDLYRDLWHERLAEGQRVDWDDELDRAGRLPARPRRARAHLRRARPPTRPPVAAQRKLEFAIAPGVEWTVQCYLDLETDAHRRRRHDDPDRRRLQGQEQRPLPGASADHDPQAGLYLAGRWLDRRTRRASSASRRSPSPANAAST